MPPPKTIIWDSVPVVHLPIDSDLSRESFEEAQKLLKPGMSIYMLVAPAEQYTHDVREWLRHQHGVAHAIVPLAMLHSTFSWALLASSATELMWIVSGGKR